MSLVASHSEAAFEMRGVTSLCDMEKYKRPRALRYTSNPWQFMPLTLELEDEFPKAASSGDWPQQDRGALSRVNRGNSGLEGSRVEGLDGYSEMVCHHALDKGRNKKHGQCCRTKRCP